MRGNQNCRWTQDIPTHVSSHSPETKHFNHHRNIIYLLSSSVFVVSFRQAELAFARWRLCTRNFVLQELLALVIGLFTKTSHLMKTFQQLQKNCWNQKIMKAWISMSDHGAINEEVSFGQLQLIPLSLQYIPLDSLLPVAFSNNEQDRLLSFIVR